MAAQFSYGNSYDSPKKEYQAEVLKKRLLGSKANFAYLRFKKSMQKLLAE